MIFPQRVSDVEEVGQLLENKSKNAMSSPLASCGLNCCPI
jgi:hypothetical protein